METEKAFNIDELIILSTSLVLYEIKHGKSEISNNIKEKIITKLSDNWTPDDNNKKFIK